MHLMPPTTAHPAWQSTALARRSQSVQCLPAGCASAGRQSVSSWPAVGRGRPRFWFNHSWPRKVCSGHAPLYPGRWVENNRGPRLAELHGGGMPQAAPKRTRCCSVRLGRVRTSSSVRWPAAYLQAVDCRVGWNSRAGLTSVMVLSVKHNMHSCAMEGAALVHGGSRPACGAHHLAAVAWPVPQISMNVDMTWRKGRGAGGDEEHWSSCHVRTSY